jgi:excisionase family DNA binding protein
VTGLLTARQVAELIGVSPETILRWARRGELPAIRLPGGAIRFRQDDLDNWLQERTATPRRGVLPTPQDAAERARYRRGGTVARATHPEDEE